MGEAFEDIARANGITKAELLRRLIQALVETMKRGKAGRRRFQSQAAVRPRAGMVVTTPNPPPPSASPQHKPGSSS